MVDFAHLQRDSQIGCQNPLHFTYTYALVVCVLEKLITFNFRLTKVYVIDESPSLTRSPPAISS